MSAGPEHARVHGGDKLAEEALVGAMLLRPSNIDEAARGLVPDDFRTTIARTLFVTLVDMRRAGIPVDAVSLVDWLARNGMLPVSGGATEIARIMESAPSVSGIGRYVAIIADLANRRKLLERLSEATEYAYQIGASDYIENAAEQVRTVPRSGVITPPSDLVDSDAFMNQVDTTPTPWVVPGLVRRRWRVMVIGGEGIGKMVLLRQIAVGAACGVNALNPRVRFDPVKVLMIDLENSRETIASQLAMSVKPALRMTRRTPGENLMLLPREGGMDLRSRSDQAELEATMEAVRPDMVVLGPIYKASRRKPREDYEEHAMELARYLDELRVRFDCALLLESHMAKNRDVKTPLGSSVWMRWPELGFALTAIGEGDDRNSTLSVDRYRQPRNGNQWPISISHQQDGFPWGGTWPTGTLNASPRSAAEPYESESEPTLL